jgi:hypothetical protein
VPVPVRVVGGGGLSFWEKRRKQVSHKTEEDKIKHMKTHAHRHET